MQRKNESLWKKSVGKINLIVCREQVINILHYNKKYFLNNDITIKQSSIRRNRKEGIRNVNQGHHAAANQHGTTVSLMDHVVAKQPQKINRIFVQIFS